MVSLSFCMSTLVLLRCKTSGRPAELALHFLVLHVQFMGDVLLSAKERLKVDMRNAAAQFERFEGDTGSTEVQGAQACAPHSWLWRFLGL